MSEQTMMERVQERMEENRVLAEAMRADGEPCTLDRQTAEEVEQDLRREDAAKEWKW